MKISDKYETTWPHYYTIWAYNVGYYLLFNSPVSKYYCKFSIADIVKINDNQYL